MRVRHDQLVANLLVTLNTAALAEALV